MFLYYFFLFITNKQEEMWVAGLEFFCSKQEQKASLHMQKVYSSERGLRLDMSDMTTTEFS